MSRKKLGAVDGSEDSGGVNGESLKSYILKIESLNDEKANLSADISSLFAAAKSDGFDVAVMREIIKRRAKDKAALEEMDTMIDIYERAVDNAPFDNGKVRVYMDGEKP